MRADPRPGSGAVPVADPWLDELPPLARESFDEAADRARQRVAWLILIGGLAVFCGVIVAAVSGVSWYRDNALTPREAKADAIEGTVAYQPEGAVNESVLKSGTKLSDGDRVRTGRDALAWVSLPDGSTVLLWPETAFEVKQLRSSTYNNNRSVTVLALSSGHARVEVAVPATLERRFEVQTPQARALLREGNYRIDVGPNGTDVSVRTGSASVTALDQTVEVLRHERTVVAPGGKPSTPASATRGLVRNGDFARGFTDWRLGSRNEEDGVPGQVSLAQADGRYIVRMRRQGSQKHGETFLQQAIERDVRDDELLRLVLDVKVVDQVLSGGGWLGSEYPLLVKLRYRDAYGSEATLVRGFYIKNDEGRPTTNGMLIPANQWVPVTIDLFDDRAVVPRPAHLLWLELEGSGWDYESFVTGIQLLAE